MDGILNRGNDAACSDSSNIVRTGRYRECSNNVKKAAVGAKKM